MTKLLNRIAEIEGLARLATPGPWVSDRPWLSRGLMHVDGVMPRANLHPGEPYQVKTEHNHGSCSYARHVAVPAHGHSAEDRSESARNMDYIAAMSPDNALKFCEALRECLDGLNREKDRKGMCQMGPTSDIASEMIARCNGDYDRLTQQAYQLGSHNAWADSASDVTQCLKRVSEIIGEMKSVDQILP